jgi:hypothetical protein
MSGSGHDIERRVERLERELRRWRLLAAVGGLALGVLALGGAARPRAGRRVLAASEFRLVDAAGVPRAVLQMSGSSPELALRGAAGKDRALLALGPDGSPKLALASPAGTVRVLLSVGSDGAPALELRDDEGQVRAASSLAADGSPSIVLSGAGGRRRASLAVEAGGAAALDLDDGTGASRARFSTEQDGSPRLKLTEATGAPRASLGATPLTETGSGKNETTEASTLVLFDRKGRVVFLAPK